MHLVNLWLTVKRRLTHLFWSAAFLTVAWQVLRENGYFCMLTSQQYGQIYISWSHYRASTGSILGHSRGSNIRRTCICEGKIRQSINDLKRLVLPWLALDARDQKNLVWNIALQYLQAQLSSCCILQGNSMIIWLLSHMPAFHGALQSELLCCLNSAAMALLAQVSGLRLYPYYSVPRLGRNFRHALELGI